MNNGLCENCERGIIIHETGERRIPSDEWSENNFVMKTVNGKYETGKNFERKYPLEVTQACIFVFMQNAGSLFTNCTFTHLIFF